MYTLLLVDDEEEVIEAIVKKVKWEELGFQVTGHANNGFKAMDMLEEMQPDVVMTDIRMPYMDGLELCAHIKAKYPATKILLFTGFDDFEYAKEAVHLEIEEYILKPLNAVEITEVFKRLKEKLDYEISEKRNTDLLKNIMRIPFRCYRRICIQRLLKDVFRKRRCRIILRITRLLLQARGIAA